MTIADRIRSHVAERYIEPARSRGEETVTVVAGAVLRDLELPGDYAPSVCSALRARKFSAEHDLELITVDGPKSKSSTRTAFTYRLPRGSETDRHGPVRNAIRHMRGIGRDTFAALGGGENWLRKEREAFDTTLADHAGKRELAGKLQAMINAAEWGEKTTMAALFGIIYRQEIKAAGGAAGIAKRAGIDNVNVNLGCRLADYVTPNGDVVDAWKNEAELEAHDETIRTGYREESTASRRPSPASGRWLRRYGASAEELEALRLAVAARCPQVRFCGWTGKGARIGEYSFRLLSGRSVVVQAPTKPTGELRRGISRWRFRLTRPRPGHARDLWEELADAATLDEVVDWICARNEP